MSFGTAVITRRWLYVLAAATPSAFEDAIICDETLEQLDPASILPIPLGDSLRYIQKGLGDEALEFLRMAPSQKFGVSPVASTGCICGESFGSLKNSSMSVRLDAGGAFFRASNCEM